MSTQEILHQLELAAKKDLSKEELKALCSQAEKHIRWLKSHIDNVRYAQKSI